jgi:hypothetical protein
MHRIVVMLACAVSLLLIVPSAPAHADQRCFPETGYCIDGKIREFWEKNGGLAVFGFPIGEIEYIISEGQEITMQRFERNRIELHPWNSAPYDVQLGRLGVTRLERQGRDWFTFGKSDAQPGCRYFAETGHNVCGDILKAWRKNGLQLDRSAAVSEAESLALFGLPLSDLMVEKINGKEYQVQWFERARFELHPENSAPYNVLLGLLGNEVGKFGLTFNRNKFVSLSDADATANDKPISDYMLNINDFQPGSEQLWNSYAKRNNSLCEIRSDAIIDSHSRLIYPKRVKGVYSIEMCVMRTSSSKSAHELMNNWYNQRVSAIKSKQTQNILTFVPEMSTPEEYLGYCTNNTYVVLPKGKTLPLIECDTFEYFVRTENIILHMEIERQYKQPFILIRDFANFAVSRMVN